jgi:BirA family transcriptional regulator, biotin operon repressor / biotin---[acetyl-CoA-carboxylase] ligase
METLFVGKNTIFLPEIPSTNSYATHLLKNVNLAEGTVVHTANQTQGRGQWDKRWSSEPSSNLTVSVVLKPTFLELKKQFLLYQIAALACYDTIAGLLNNSQYDIKIKWPNDILINRKKTAGILIENKTRR